MYKFIKTYMIYAAMKMKFNVCITRRAFYGVRGFNAWNYITYYATILIISFIGHNNVGNEISNAQPVVIFICFH